MSEKSKVGVREKFVTKWEMRWENEWVAKTTWRNEAGGAEDQNHINTHSLPPAPKSLSFRLLPMAKTGLMEQSVQLQALKY